MLKKIVKAAAVSTAAAVFVGSAVMPAASVHAATKAELQQQKSETQSQLSSADAKVSQLEGEQDEIEEQLNQVKTEIATNMAAIAMLEDQIDDTQEQINIKQAQYNDAQAREKEQYEAMKIRIRYMYEKGNTSYMQLLLEANSIGEALNKADYIDQLYTYDRKLLVQYQETQEEVKTAKQELEEQRSELQASQEGLEEEKAALEEHQNELKENYDDYETLIEEAADEASALRQRLEEQTAAIAAKEEEEARAAEEARKAAEAAAKAAEEAAKAAAGESTDDSSEDEEEEETTSQKTYAPPGSATGKNVADYACQFVGNPYVYGGTSLTNGCDCSGFVMSVYKQFGVSLPRTAEAMRSSGMEVASLDDAAPGDIVCYPGHVGIYIGNGTIVHASTAATGIKYSSVTYRPYITIRRLV